MLRAALQPERGQVLRAFIHPSSHHIAQQVTIPLSNASACRGAGGAMLLAVWRASQGVGNKAKGSHPRRLGPWIFNDLVSAHRPPLRWPSLRTLPLPTGCERRPRHRYGDHQQVWSHRDPGLTQKSHALCLTNAASVPMSSHIPLQCARAGLLLGASVGALSSRCDTAA